MSIRRYLNSLLFLLLGSLAGCDAPEEASGRSRSGEQGFPVVVEPVVLSTEKTRVEAVGTSRALRSVTLHPATSGEVVAVNFEPGEFVEKGAALVELDQRDERLAVELAQSRLDEARRQYERYKDSREATTRATLDTAKTELEVVRIELDRARVALDDRTINAPFSGYVGITDVDVGDRVQPDTPIVSLDDRSSLLVRFEVPEVIIGKLDVGDLVRITAWNADAVTAQGEVVDIDSRIDPATRTFTTRARVDNSDDALRPGMSFRVTLEVQGPRYPVISEVALRWGAEGSYIWTVVDGRAKRVPVSIVQRQKGRVLVKSDLPPGELVVVEGIQRLRSGVEIPPEMVAVRDTSTSGTQLDFEPTEADAG